MKPTNHLPPALQDLSARVDHLRETLYGNLPDLIDEPSDEQKLSRRIEELIEWGSDLCRAYGSPHSSSQPVGVVGVFISTRTGGDSPDKVTQFLGPLPTHLDSMLPVPFLGWKVGELIHHGEDQGKIPLDLENWPKVSEMMQSWARTLITRATQLVTTVEGYLADFSSALLPTIRKAGEGKYNYSIVIVESSGSQREVQLTDGIWESLWRMAREGEAEVRYDRFREIFNLIPELKLWIRRTGKRRRGIPARNSICHLDLVIRDRVTDETG